MDLFSYLPLLPRQVFCFVFVFLWFFKLFVLVDLTFHIHREGRTARRQLAISGRKSRQRSSTRFRSSSTRRRRPRTSRRAWNTRSTLTTLLRCVRWEFWIFARNSLTWRFTIHFWHSLVWRASSPILPLKHECHLSNLWSCPMMAWHKRTPSYWVNYDCSFCIRVS